MSRAKGKILVFIPVYNCENQIVRVLQQFDNEVSKYFHEIIVINNLSNDGTEKVIIDYLKSSSPKLKVSLLRNKSNYSLGGSHKVAFDYALKNSFQYIVVLHGDDQGNIVDLVPYINNNEIAKYDSYLGSRFEPDSKLINYSRFRITGNKVMNFFISIMVFRKLTDLGSGLNIYKTEYLKSKFYMNFPNNLTFNVYMLLYGVFIKSAFAFFPLKWREEDQISNAKLLSQTKEIISLVLKYSFSSGKVFNKQANLFSEIQYESDVIYSNFKE